MHLIFDLPWYFFLFCLLLGAAYSALLYFLNIHNKAFTTRTQWVLATLRFISVSLIAFLLLAPLAKRDINQHEKPIIVIAQDNSQSITLCKDSSYYRGDYAQQMQQLIKQLSKDYNIQCYTYGSTITQSSALSYKEKSTDVSTLLSDIAKRYENRNIGALVLTGDGIYNQGLNPISTAEGLTFPVYTIALGDTSTRRDAAITDVRFNRIAYLDNQFPIEITVNATQLQGEQKVLTVTHAGKQVFSKKLNYTDNNFSTTEQVLLNADKPGIQTYTINLAPATKEASTHNNQHSIAVEVIDGHQEVAIIAATPHPDVAALRQSIEQNKNWKVSTFLANDFKDSPSKYDLIILHELPSKVVNSSVAQTVVNAHVPTIFILGNQSDLARFNTLHTGLEIFSKLDRQNESTPLYNGAFTYFTIDDNVRQIVEQFPPLASPFGDYRTSGNTQTLFTAKVGSVPSGLPLIAFTQQQAVRYAFVTGEGIWKWRMTDYLMNQSHNAFNTLVNKMVVYTSLRVNKDRFHVNAKAIYNENEPVSIEAELYNENYELINTPDADFTIQTLGHPNTKTYNFNRSNNGYSLNLGVLSSGDYHYTASTNYGGKKLTASGNFIVENLQLEDLNLKADHSLLNTLSSNTGGTTLYPQQLNQLPKLLKQRNDIKTVIYSNPRYTELINLPLFLILIVLFLSAEWVLRKYYGKI